MFTLVCGDGAIVASIIRLVHCLVQEAGLDTLIHSPRRAARVHAFGVWWHLVKIWNTMIFLTCSQ